MDKLRMESPDMTAQNIDRIAALFPNCVTEASDGHGGIKRAINFELLKQMLSPDVVDGDERYEFTWVGKKAAIAEANKPIRKTLRPCVEESKNWDTTENLYIEGDNLEVLKLLQESYLGKVKMIYIDPPYNTGNDFIYADDFMRSQEEENVQMGMYDEDDNRLFKNTDTNGRFHSDWCSMIYSRLMLARNLLTEDGLLFVSIDDNENATMRELLDETLGSGNFVACIVWQKIHSIVETRYRTETRTGTRTVTDPDTGESYEEEYEYTVQVPYSYYICNVTLENFNLSHVPVYIMGQDELSMYATYMSVLGNREDLFPSSGYVDKYITNPPSDYEVPAEYLSDERFATLLVEAEKYLGYPYVWGGSNPETSFDCSGFVSYVLTNSGLVNTGRLGAQGLYNICTPVSKANAKPGDLIFFKGTYDTPGVSHVGIYVGDNVMLHCGDPIQYTSISSSYWQSHFFAFGRPPY